MKNRLAALLTLAIAAAPAPAHALLCIPLVGCSCNVSATNINFGGFSPLAGAQDAVGEVSVVCTGVIDLAPTISVKLTQGQWGVLAARKMRSGAGVLLDYNIYSNAQHTIIWGDGSAGAPAVTVSGGLIVVNTWSVTRTMYARAAPLAATQPGGYADTVTVRIDW